MKVFFRDLASAWLRTLRAVKAGFIAAPVVAGLCLLNACQETPGAMQLDAPSEVVPPYFDLLQSLKARGFVFMNFGEFWRADKQHLPEKLIVIRHDVHHRDIVGARGMRAIEAALLPENSATYFVMLDFPPESANAPVQQDYLDLILELAAEGVDVQPHISPDDMYVSQYRPPWREKSTPQLEAFAHGDYTIDTFRDGIEIIPAAHDVLQLRSINDDLPGLLTAYNQRWQSTTGLKASYYAAHGSHLALNHVLNNELILDQRELLATGIYEFDTYNTRVHNYLDDLSDNDQPDWMDHPETIADGRYQLLAHPALWMPADTTKRLKRERNALNQGGQAGQ